MAGVLFTSSAWGNLGLNIGDDADSVLNRRRDLQRSLSLSSLIYMEQTHSNVVSIVDEDVEIVKADAIVTSHKNVGLAVLVGDCVPILIRSSHAVAAVHAGRKGMMNGIVKETVMAMRSYPGDNFEAIMGPSICSDCYEVSPEMYGEVTADFPSSATTIQKHALDMHSELAEQLTAEGVEVLNLGICTHEYPEYYSHRRSQKSGTPEGRQVGVIWL